MTKRCLTLSAISVAVVLLGCTHNQRPEEPQHSGTQAESPVLVGEATAVAVTPLNQTVLRYRGKALSGSRWGLVGDLQHSMNAALEACGKSPLQLDGIFGKNSREGLRRLASCPDFADLSMAEGEEHDGHVTVGIWTRLNENSPTPVAIGRAFVLWLTHEGTDYDVAEFNISSNGTPQPNDPKSFLTWGPYGATVGHGAEVQRILSSPELASVLASCFGTELTALQTLLPLRKEAARPLMTEIASTPARRSAWKAAFKCLGSEKLVRDAYERLAWGQDWFMPNVRALAKIVTDSGSQVSETDFAMFVDIGMHMTVTNQRIQAVKTALAAPNLPNPLSSAARRQAIGQALVATLSNQIEDRRGRNVVYYVDGIGEANLSAAERQAWQTRSGLKASDLGLADQPLPIP